LINILIANNSQLEQNDAYSYCERFSIARALFQKIFCRQFSLHKEFVKQIYSLS
jgi:hypothetical protein